MGSSQAAVESCHRNWLAVWQGRALSSLVWKHTSVTNHLRIRTARMLSSTKPWRGPGTSALPQGKLRTALCVNRGQPGRWCTLGWVPRACSAPCPYIRVAHKRWLSWYKPAVAFLAVRIIGQKTKQSVPGSGSFVLLFGMRSGWDMLLSQRMGILLLLSVWHLFYKLYLLCQQHKHQLTMILDMAVVWVSKRWLFRAQAYLIVWVFAKCTFI